MNNLIIKFINNLNITNSNLLVIGPGKSTILINEIFNKSFKEIDLIDHNQEALNFQKNLLKNNSNTFYYNKELSNTESIKFLNKQYKIIICTEVLEHVHNNSELLINLYKLLELDGILIASVPNMTIDKFLMKINNNYMLTEDSSKGHVNFYNKNNFKNILKEAGFKIDSLSGIASEFLPLHFMLALNKTNVDEDTGEIYNSNSLLVRIGGFLMKIIIISRLNLLLNKFIPRCYLAIVKK